MFHPQRFPATLWSLFSLILATGLICPCRAVAGWQLQASGTTARLEAVTASHSNDVNAWACGEGGLILHTTNGGGTWVQQASGTTEDLYDIVFWELTGGPVIAVGNHGTILYTEDSGATWAPRTSGTTEALRAAADFGKVIAGDSGTLLTSQDAITWTPVEGGPEVRFNAVTTPFRPLVVGEGGAIYSIWNGTFTPIDVPTTEDLYSTPMFGDDIVVGDHGVILQQANGAAEWVLRPSGTTRRLRAIEGASINASRYYAVGDGGLILKTTDGGATWGAQASGTTADLRGVFFYLGDSHGYAVGDNGTILRTTDGGGPIVPTAVDPAEASVSPVRLEARPNPFRAETNLWLRIPEAGPVRVEVFDPTSRRVARWDRQVAAGAMQISFRPEGLARGFYLGRLTTSFGATTCKILRVE